MQDLTSGDLKSGASVQVFITKTQDATINDLSIFPQPEGQ